MIKNEDIIIQLAKKAGLEQALGSWCQECSCTDEALLKFAKLVASAEREECAIICEQRANILNDQHPSGIATDYFIRGAETASMRLAAAIRARG